MHPLPHVPVHPRNEIHQTERLTIREALEQREGQYPHASAAPRPPASAAGLAPRARPAPLARHPPGAAARPPPPPLLPSRPARGAAGLRGEWLPAARRSHTCSGRRAQRCGQSAGGAAAQARRQLRGRRQVGRWTCRTRGRELIPGARRPDCAASGLPCVVPQPRIQWQAGGQAQSFLLRPESAIDPRQPPWLGGGAGGARSERSEASGDLPCLWPLGRSAVLKQQRRSGTELEAGTGESAATAQSRTVRMHIFEGLNTRFNSRLFLVIFLPVANKIWTRGDSSQKVTDKQR